MTRGTSVGFPNFVTCRYAERVTGGTSIGFPHSPSPGWQAANLGISGGSPLRKTSPAHVSKCVFKCSDFWLLQQPPALGLVSDRHQKFIMSSVTLGAIHQCQRKPTEHWQTCSLRCVCYQLPGIWPQYQHPLLSIHLLPEVSEY